MKTLAERLYEERERRELSQEELAAKAHVSQALIAALETGRQASSGYLPEIAYVLGLQAIWLKKGVGPKEIHPVTSAANEPGATYGAAVFQLPTEHPLKRELAAIADRMSERGLQVLIYEAEKIDKLYPKAQANPAR